LFFALIFTIMPFNQLPMGATRFGAAPWPLIGGVL
jgi:hypothetical protein